MTEEQDEQEEQEEEEESLILGAGFIFIPMIEHTLIRWRKVHTLLCGIVSITNPVAVIM